MIENFSLNKSDAAVLLIDVQEKLFPLVASSQELLSRLQIAVQAFQVLDLPFFVTEQYPQGLGKTVPELKVSSSLTKTTFSCLADSRIRETLLSQSAKQWILMGIEAHVCVLQSAKELLKEGKQVTVLKDLISSRSLKDYETAIAEMRDIGVRVTSLEIVLFELMHDAKCAEFKQVSQLIK